MLKLNKIQSTVS